MSSSRSSRRTKYNATFFEVNNEIYMEVDEDIAVLVLVRNRNPKHLSHTKSESAVESDASEGFARCKPLGNAIQVASAMETKPEPGVIVPHVKRTAEESGGDVLPKCIRKMETPQKNIKELSTGSTPPILPTLPLVTQPSAEVVRQEALKTEKNCSSEVDNDDDDYSTSTEEDDRYSPIASRLIHLLDSTQSSSKEANILLLGSTGVGKSTFINSFANYITYGRLEAALHGEILCLIPTSFTITDAQYNEVKVEIGKSANEDQAEGQSRTQNCRCYEFNVGGLKLRLIDTPGIGDTRGIIYDKRNFDQTLAFIGQFEALHGICILLKPNEARLTATFQFCIKQLLCHLAASASRNITFVFTNARGTFYRPGDTAPTLKRILQELSEHPPYSRVEFSGRNTFCLDSEAFRFLLALRQGVAFKPEERASFEGSWQHSVEECLRLVKHVLTLPPHPIRDTVSINEARKLIQQLSKPLADIVDNIETNLKVLEAHRLEIMGNVESIKDLMTKSVIPIVDIDIQTIGRPRTVCTGQKCRKVYQVGSIHKYHYPVSCHDPCNMNYLSGELVDVPEMRLCDAMDRCGICRRCGCSYRVHMHIYYTTKEVERRVADTNVQHQIKTKEDAKLFTEFKVRELEERSAILKEERDKITSTAAQFAQFLKHNAIAPYNDSFEAYLQHLIENQKTMAQEEPSLLQSVEGLENMLKAYREEKAIFEMTLGSDDGAPQASMMSPPQKDVTLDKIFSLRDELYGLKITGNYIRQLHLAQEVPRLSEYATERIVISQNNRSRSAGPSY